MKPSSTSFTTPRSSIGNLSLHIAHSICPKLPIIFPPNLSISLLPILMKWSIKANNWGDHPCHFYPLYIIYGEVILTILSFSDSLDILSVVIVSGCAIFNDTTTGPITNHHHYVHTSVLESLLTNIHQGIPYAKYKSFNSCLHFQINALSITNI